MPTTLPLRLAGSHDRGRDRGSLGAVAGLLLAAALLTATASRARWPSLDAGRAVGASGAAEVASCTALGVPCHLLSP